MAKATIQGIELAYTDQGKGTPILLIHGFPLNRSMWDPQVEALSRDCRMIAVDLRGHGESETPLWRYSMDIFADDLSSLLNHLSIDRAVIAGFSMGGYVAFAFYRRHRARVQGLILVDTRPQPDSPEGQQGRFKMAQTARKEGAHPIAETMLPKLLSEKTRQGRTDTVDRVRTMITRTDRIGIAGDLMAMADRPDSVPTLDEIKCPTLVIVGEQDGLTPPADAKLMADRIEGAKLVTIPDAAHLTPLEQPEAVNRAIKDFLKSLR